MRVCAKTFLVDRHLDDKQIRDIPKRVLNRCEMNMVIMFIEMHGRDAFNRVEGNIFWAIHAQLKLHEKHLNFKPSIYICIERLLVSRWPYNSLSISDRAIHDVNGKPRMKED